MVRSALLVTLKTRHARSGHFRICLHKHQSHRDDREYRFAFGTRSDVFDFENVFGLVVPPGYVHSPQNQVDPQAHRPEAHLGNLRDCCRLFARSEWAPPSR